MSYSIFLHILLYSLFCQRMLTCLVDFLSILTANTVHSLNSHGPPFLCFLYFFCSHFYLFHWPNLPSNWLLLQNFNLWLKLLLSALIMYIPFHSQYIFSDILQTSHLNIFKTKHFDTLFSDNPPPLLCFLSQEKKRVLTIDEYIVDGYIINIYWGDELMHQIWFLLYPNDNWREIVPKENGFIVTRWEERNIFSRVRLVFSFCFST